MGGVGGEAHLIGKNGKVIVFGGAPNLGFSVDPARPAFNTLTLINGSWPFANEVVIDQSTAKKKDLEVGQTIGVQANGPVQQMRISGLVKFGGAESLGGATLAGFDLETGQKLFQKPGKLDQIRAKAKPGITPQKLASEIQGILPAGTQVRTSDAQAQEDAKDTESFLNFLQDFLLAFGGIALFVGSFVIANSLSITIAQRTRELATLRTLGASRRQVLRSIMVESFVIGVLSSIVGILVGLGLGVGLFKLFDAVGFTLPNNGLVLHTRTIVVAMLVGVLVTLAREPPSRLPLDARAADRGSAGRRNAAAGAVRPIPPAGSDPADAARLRGARLRALREGSRHDEDPRLHGPRDAADLLRDGAVVVALRPAASHTCSAGRQRRSAARREHSRATTPSGTRSGRHQRRLP